MSADTVNVHQVTCDHCGHTAHIGTRPSALDWALADLGWKGDTTKLCPACADAGEDRMVASGYRITTTEETAVTHDEPQPPIPGADQPHAYVAVWRLHSPWADRPEWDERTVVVIPEWDRERLDRLGAAGATLLPIGPDGDTGTRAITEPRRIETAEELNALPLGSVVLHPDNVAFARLRDRIGIAWRTPGSKLMHSAGDLLSDGAVTVLHVPTEEASGE